MDRPRGSHRVRIAALSLVVAVALAVWGTWPVATCLRACVVDATASGYVGAAFRRDVDLIVWILAWGAHALTTRPWAVFEAPIFHPAPHGLATTEHLLGLQPIYLPLALATGDPILAHQATLLATFAAAFLATLVLVRQWTGSWMAGGFAGVLYAFSPFRAVHLPALQIEAAWVLPLIVLALERVAAGGGSGWTIALATVIALQALNSYYLAYATLVLVGVLLVFAVADRRTRGRTGPLVAATLAAAVVMAACSLPYLQARGEGTLGAVDPVFAAASSARPGKTGATFAVLLAVAGMPWWRRGLVPSVRGPWPVALAVAGLVAHLLALGPRVGIGGETVAGPFALVASIVPGWGLIRAPIRLNVVATLAAAVLAGLGVAGLAARVPRGARAIRASAFAIALVAVPFVMRPVPLQPVVPAGSEPAVYDWLSHALAGAVVELPFHDFDSRPVGRDVEARRQRYQVRHWRPLLGGYSGYVPPPYAVVSALARALPDPRALELLVRTTGVRWIVVHRAELARAARRRWAAADDIVRVVAVRGPDVVFTPRARAPVDLEAALLHAAPGTTILGAPRVPLAEPDRRATVELDEPLRAIPFLDRAEPRVRVTNRGSITWPAMSARRDPHLVTLAYRWLDSTGRVLSRNDDAGRLPWDPAPNETITARVVVRAPGAPGATRLDVGVTQDGGWLAGTASQCFTTRGAPSRCEAR
jgi:hypothetical protein